MSELCSLCKWSASPILECLAGEDTSNFECPVFEPRNKSFISPNQLKKQGGISFFVEDETEKAKKLAQICDIVFLIDQPYNQEELPENIIRVTSWERLYQELGKFTLC